VLRPFIQWKKGPLTSVPDLALIQIWKEGVHA
jgi:hypothetical protein